jgi:hypothetical protein
MVLKNFLTRSPGGEDEGGSFTSNINDDDTKVNEESLHVKEEDKEKKPFPEKLREALQDWSNDDQKDQDIDDSTP